MSETAKQGQQPQQQPLQRLRRRAISVACAFGLAARPPTALRLGGALLALLGALATRQRSREERDTGSAPLAHADAAALSGTRDPTARIAESAEIEVGGGAGAEMASAGGSQVAAAPSVAKI